MKHLHDDAIEKSRRQNRNRPEDCGETNAGDRAGDGRLEFRLRAARLRLSHLRYSAEDEQRDLPHRDSEPAGNDTMTQFMQEHTAEQGEGTQGTEHPICES